LTEAWELCRAKLITWDYIGQALWSCERCQISNYIILLITFLSIGNFAIYKKGTIIAILQIIKIPSIGNVLQIYKNGQIIAILQIAIYKKTAKLLQFCKLLKSPSIGNFCNSYKTANIIAILLIAIYKNCQIIAILQIIKISLYREL
jgi:hypothetical protein